MFLFILVIFSQFLKHIYHYLKIWVGIFQYLHFTWFYTWLPARILVFHTKTGTLKRGLSQGGKRMTYLWKYWHFKTPKGNVVKAVRKRRMDVGRKKERKDCERLKSGSHWTWELGGVTTLPLPKTGLFQLFTSHSACSWQFPWRLALRLVLSDFASRWSAIQLKLEIALSVCFLFLSLSAWQP